MPIPPPLHTAPAPPPQGKDTISLFVPCLVHLFRSSVARGCMRILKELDLPFVVPAPGVCCGQPAYNQGFHKEARRVAKRWIAAHEPYAAVLAPSGSCINMVRNHYFRLFDGDPVWRERACRLAARTYELTEYLVQRAPHAGRERALDLRVTYHDSCHLTRYLGIRREPRMLLRNVRGLSLVEMEHADRCCGFGGLFSFTHRPLAQALVEDKVTWIEESGAEAVITGETGCLLNLEDALRRKGSSIRAYHIAEVLGGCVHD